MALNLNQNSAKYDRIERAVAHLSGRGLPTHQIAAMIGHGQNESGFRTSGAVGDAGTAFGLYQWRHDRMSNLRNFASQRGEAWDNLETQLDFALHEMGWNGSYPGKTSSGTGRGSEGFAGSKFFSAGNVEQATAAYMHFERPAGWSRGNPRGGHNFHGRLRDAEIAHISMTNGRLASAMGGVQFASHGEDALQYVAAITNALDQEEQGLKAFTEKAKDYTGGKAYVTQEVMESMLDKLGISQSILENQGIDWKTYQQERGRLSEEEAKTLEAEIDALPDDQKAGYEGTKNILKKTITENGKEVTAYYDLSKAQIGEESQKVLGAVGTKYDALSEDEKATFKKEAKEKFEAAKQDVQNSNIKDPAYNNVGDFGFDDMFGLLIMAMFAYAAGYPELAAQLLNGFGPGGNYNNPGNNYGVNTKGTGRGYSEHGYTDSPTAQDILAGKPILGTTNNPNQPYWAALGPDGDLVGGNMAFVRATPMSTTKSATLLTIFDMMAKGELPANFADKHASNIDAMIQRSSNSAPVALAKAASGSEAAFVRRMNLMAEERGLEGTHFANPVGFNTGTGGHYSTAHDVAKVGYILANEYGELSKRYMDIGGRHTGRAFDGINGTSMGKTGTGRGDEGRSVLATGQNLAANKAFMGMVGKNGAAYAVLEATSTERQRYIETASATAISGRTGVDVGKERQDTLDSLSFSGPLAGLPLDVDMNKLVPNKNGVALTVIATGNHGKGITGELLAVDVRTGKVLRNFPFISGGAGPASENKVNGPAPGLQQMDFVGSEDITARWGVSNKISYNGKSHWKDADGELWHIQTTDPLSHRDGIWIHPSNGSTHGCFGLKPQVAKEFKEFYEAQGGFAEMTFINQNVLSRSHTKLKEQQEQERVAREQREQERIAAAKIKGALKVTDLNANIRDLAVRIGADLNKDGRITDQELGIVAEEPTKLEEVASSLKASGIIVEPEDINTGSKLADAITAANEVKDQVAETTDQADSDPEKGEEVVAAETPGKKEEVQAAVSAS